MNHLNSRTAHRLVALLSLGLILLAACATPQPDQSRTFKIGEINIGTRFDVNRAGFKAGMADRGYVEGKNVTYLYDGVVNTAEKQDATAKKMVAEKVDLIVAYASASALAAQKATAGTNIPVLFLPLIDPVKDGLVKSVVNPGGNCTGIRIESELYGKELEWLLKIAPNIKRVYVPYDVSNNAALALALTAIKAVAPNLGVELVLREINNADEVSAAIADITGDAIILLPNTTLVTARMDDFIKASLERKLPLSSSAEVWVNSGALISYSINDTAVGKQAARLADRLLKGGVKPADLPVESAEYFLSINLKTAQAIGLTVPDDVLRSATTVVR